MSWLGSFFSFVLHLNVTQTPLTMKNPLQVLHYCTATAFSDTATVASLVTFVLDGFHRGLHFDWVEFSSVSNSHHFSVKRTV